VITNPWAIVAVFTVLVLYSVVVWFVARAIAAGGEADDAPDPREGRR
jgi:hypothetical protein